MRGNEVDLEKASRLIVDEFRKGVIGRITLEIPTRGEADNAIKEATIQMQTVDVVIDETIDEESDDE